MYVICLKTCVSRYPQRFEEPLPSSTAVWTCLWTCHLQGSVCNRTGHPSKGRLASPPWGRKNCKAKPRSFPQKWLNLHTLQVKQATNRHKTAKNLMKNMIQCRIKTDRDSGLKTPSDAMRRVPGGSPDQKHPTWERGVSPAIPNGPAKRTPTAAYTSIPVDLAIGCVQGPAGGSTCTRNESCTAPCCILSAFK